LASLLLVLRWDHVGTETLARMVARTGPPAVMVNGSASGKVEAVEVISTLRMMFASPRVASSIAK
jgi:hypothetical protein